MPMAKDMPTVHWLLGVAKLPLIDRSPRRVCRMLPSWKLVSPPVSWRPTPRRIAILSLMSRSAVRVRALSTGVGMRV